MRGVPGYPLVVNQVGPIPFRRGVLGIGNQELARLGELVSVPPGIDGLGRENAASPGYHRFRETSRFLPGSPGQFQCAAGLPGFIQLFLLSFQARPVPYPVPHGPGAY